MFEAVENELSKGCEIEGDSCKNPFFQLISKGSIPNPLVSLQNHQNHQNYEKSYKILEKLFYFLNKKLNFLILNIFFHLEFYSLVESVFNQKRIVFVSSKVYEKNKRN